MINLPFIKHNPKNANPNYITFFNLFFPFETWPKSSYAKLSLKKIKILLYTKAKAKE